MFLQSVAHTLLVIWLEVTISISMALAGKFSFVVDNRSTAKTGIGAPLIMLQIYVCIQVTYGYERMHAYTNIHTGYGPYKTYN